MKKVEVHAFVLSVLAMATVNAAAEVVETTFPTRDVVIAERVLSPDGADDFAPALQGAIDDVAKNGGGVVFLKTGSYAFQTPVAVRRGVTVRGDYSPASPTKGTVLRLFGGRGDEEGVTAFSLENGSGLEGLVFFYPEQRAESPVAYPRTVRTTRRTAGRFFSPRRGRAKRMASRSSRLQLEAARAASACGILSSRYRNPWRIRGPSGHSA